MAQTRLVIVDEDPIIRLELCEMVQGLGYIVAGEAADAGSAVTLNHQLRPDLVLMDVRVPGGGDGIEAATVLSVARIAPVLLLTGFDDVAPGQRAAAAGIFGYLRKPFAAAQLRPAIELTLARCREFQRLAQARALHTRGSA